MNNRTELNNLEKIIYEDIREAVIFTDEDGYIMYCNRAAIEIFGMENDAGDGEDEAVGKSLLSFINAKKNKQLEKYLVNAYEYFGYRTEKRKGFRGFGSKSKEDNQAVKIFDELSYEIRNEGVGFAGDNGVYLLNLCFRKIENDEYRGLTMIAENVSHKKKLRQTQRDSSVTFTAIISCITLYLFFWSLTEFTLDIHLENDIYTKIIEGIAFFMFICIIAFTSLSFGDMGIFVRPDKLIKSILKVIPVIGAALLIMAGINYISRMCGYEFKEKFMGGSLDGFINYFGVCVLQEFLARGVIQTSVGNLISFKWQKFSKVIIASMIFSLMHLPFGFVFMMCSFAMGIGLGIVYEKQNTIWGCVLIHWLVGYVAMAMFL